MKFNCSLLVVEDIRRSRNFYELVMNQTVKFDFGENVTFEDGFAIHSKHHFEQLIAPGQINTGKNNFELYFEEDNLDALVQRLNEWGVVFLHRVEEQPWKQRVVRFYDPDGHLIEAGKPWKRFANGFLNNS